MIGCLPTQALAFLAVFVYATHATQAIAFEWKPGLSREASASLRQTSRAEQSGLELGGLFNAARQTVSLWTVETSGSRRAVARCRRNSLITVIQY